MVLGRWVPGSQARGDPRSAHRGAALHQGLHLPLTLVLFRVTNHNNKLIKVNWIKSSKSYLLLN